MGTWGKAYERAVFENGVIYNEIVVPHYDTPTWSSEEESREFMKTNKPDSVLIASRREIGKVIKKRKD